MRNLSQAVSGIKNVNLLFMSKSKVRKECKIIMEGFTDHLLFWNRKCKKFLSEVGFEPTPSFEDQNAHLIEAKSISLESGALDRSAILTCCKVKYFLKTIKNYLDYSNIRPNILFNIKVHLYALNLSSIGNLLHTTNESNQITEVWLVNDA